MMNSVRNENRYVFWLIEVLDVPDERFMEVCQLVKSIMEGTKLITVETVVTMYIQFMQMTKLNAKVLW